MSEKREGLKTCFELVRNLLIYSHSSLLEHGFENFVRVGSVKKIAKPVLPYRYVLCSRF